MIAYLDGVVTDETADSIVVVNNGLGYLVYSAARATPLWIHSITNAETGTKLYGFVSKADRAFFVRLLSVDGVGPKTAMAIVSSGAALSIPALCAVKGVGAKTAAKICAELSP